MLQSISWSEFFITIATLTGIYYGVTVFHFYGVELISFIKNEKYPATPKETSMVDASPVMGMTRPEKSFRVSREVKSADDLVVAPDREREDNPVDSESLLVGTVSDLLHEIKSLRLETVSLLKDECVHSIHEILSRYPQLKNTQYQEAVNLFIMNTRQESGGWEFDLHEVDLLWPQKNTSSTN